MDIEEKRRLAEAGSCAAQSILGLSYLYGYNVEVDYKEAFRFLSAAADQGSSRAVLNLGIMHAKGLGIPQNVPEAIRLFEAVANPSDSSDAFAARIELGRIYSSGLALPVDIAKAVSWYRAAVALVRESEDSEDLREARTYLLQANSGR
jgi:TPR repeat protein